jgi:hypothetical protein
MPEVLLDDEDLAVADDPELDRSSKLCERSRPPPRLPCVMNVGERHADHFDRASRRGNWFRHISSLDQGRPAGARAAVPPPGTWI